MTEYQADNNWLVYIHKVPDGKFYVGITSRSCESRWGKNGTGYKGQKFYSAIQKYRWENIEHRIFAQGLTKEKASLLETKLIKILDSISNGYNVDDGGIDNCKQPVDLSGQRFGNIIVLNEDKRYRTKSGKFQIRWNCLCDCGTQTKFTSIQLKHTNSILACEKCKSKIKSELFSKCVKEYYKTFHLTNIHEIDGDNLNVYDSHNNKIICDRKYENILKNYNLYIDYNSKKEPRRVMAKNKTEQVRLDKLLFKNESLVRVPLNGDVLDYRESNNFFTTPSILESYYNLKNNINNDSYLISRWKEYYTVPSLSEKLKTIKRYFKTKNEALAERNKLLHQLYGDLDLFKDVLNNYYQLL